MSKLEGLAELALMVENVEASLVFYRDILGMTLVSPDGRGPVHLQIGLPRAGVPHQLVLLPRPQGSPPFPERYLRSVHHIGLEVSPQELAFERERLTALGIEVRTGELAYLGVEAIYIFDPDGNEIELATRR